MHYNQKLIRNFCIIAHIDHGKSTLCDRLLEFTGAISKRDLKEQLLDDMDLERERGITIKASAVRFSYKHTDNKKYILNLIDTPGHVDFTYEVSKSLSASEGALLLIDASEGIEAQTVANYHLAKESNLKIIPVINKIDLQHADIEGTNNQLVNALKFNKEDILLSSAKKGEGIKEILSQIIKSIPPPSGSPQAPLKALVFDSSFNIYKGVIIYVRVIDGVITPQMKIKLMNTGTTHQVQEVGTFSPKPRKTDKLQCGEVGYITCNIKNAKEVSVGETITSSLKPAAQRLPGYKKIKPFVFCGIYPENSKDFVELKSALEKLRLSDASFTYEQESSESLGFGFRCGFLGLLHSEIIQERIEREFDISLVITVPSVVYRIEKSNGEVVDIHNPSKFPEVQKITNINEPWIKAFIITPQEYVSDIMQLVKNKRGIYIATEYLGENRLIITYELPLSEVIVDFYDKLKSITRGYASFDYDFTAYKKADMVKVDIMINGRVFDAFSFITHKDKAPYRARDIAEKLRSLIPRQLFQVAVQAAIGSKVIARTNISALKKHVTGKCYGGDITRKRKLWDKQKRGKKRMKQFGNVQIPQEAFKEILKI
ncbi:MAG: translation elongation factor 4 [Candidatus Omnitrophica bacterium]|nr:translation elongation factor 4 [Candidatus Omnitrophota bacterium]